MKAGTKKEIVGEWQIYIESANDIEVKHKYLKKIKHFAYIALFIIWGWSLFNYGLN